MQTVRPNAVIEAVKTLLAASGDHDMPTFSEAEFVRCVVEDFGNRGEMTGPLVSVAAATFETSGDVEVLRTLFRVQLEEVAKGEITEGFRTDVFVEADRVVLVPITTGPDVKFRVYPESLDAVIAFALKLLIREEHGKDLKQCQRKDCGRFFFGSVRRQKAGHETGRFPDKYCSREHMMAAHRERATAATIRRRKQLKEQRAHKPTALTRRKQESE